MTPGERIRDARRALGWSQETLGQHAQVSRRTILRVESGATVNRATLICIAYALGVDPEEILHGAAA